MPHMMLSCFRINQQIVQIAKKKFELNVSEESINLPAQGRTTDTKIPIGNLTNSYRLKGVMKTVYFRPRILRGT
jgi:hypothetical protein